MTKGEYYEKIAKCQTIEEARELILGRLNKLLADAEEQLKDERASTDEYTIWSNRARRIQSKIDDVNGATTLEGIKEIKII